LTQTIRNLFLSLIFIFSIQVAQAQDVKINEIMYNFGYNLNSLESGNWVELYNTTNAPIVMDGWQVVFGTDSYTIPSFTLMPSSYINIVSKDTVFYTAFPGIPYLGPTGFGLDNGGNDPVRVLDAQGVLVDEVIYDNNIPWDVGADGQGRSLALISPTLNNNLASSWNHSGLMGGTPGAANVNPCSGSVPNIVINEINYKSSTSSPSGDWVELYNPGTSSVNVGNWRFLDSDIAFTIPAGTSIPADGYLVIASDIGAFSSIFPSVSNVVPMSSGIGLSGNGEQIALINNNKCLIDHLKYNDSSPWPLEPDGGGPTLSLVLYTYDNTVAGSWTNSNSGSQDVYGTPGASNNISDPCAVFSVNAFITEINYDSDSLANGGDWIEIHNPNTFPIGISNYTLNSSGDGYTIPLGTIILNNDYLVVAEDIAEFSALYPTVTNVIQANSGLKLDNGGDLVTFYNTLGCLIDSVHFDNKAPWPTESAGTGYTIELYNLSSSANDLGMNWLTSADSLGTPGQMNNAQPCAIPASQPTIFNVSDNNAFASWPSASGAVSYEVDYKTLSGSTWTTVTVNAPNTFFGLTGLTACSDYEVRVRTICANGAASSYTSPVAFTTTGCFVCSAAQNTFSFNQTNNSVILTWDILVGATAYDIYYKKVSDPTFIQLAGWPFPIRVLFNIDACEDYEWYVVNNCGGATSPPSTTSTFSTLCKDDEKEAVELINSVGNIKLYPNPAKDEIFLYIDHVENIQSLNILDIQGKIISEVSIDQLSGGSIQTSHLKNGMYIMQIRTSKEIVNERFVIQR